MYQSRFRNKLNFFHILYKDVLKILLPLLMNESLRILNIKFKIKTPFLSEVLSEVK